MTFPQRWSKTFKLTSKTVPARKERLKEKMAVEKKGSQFRGGGDGYSRECPTGYQNLKIKITFK
jgi:hypothetical protein